MSSIGPGTGQIAGRESGFLADGNAFEYHSQMAHRDEAGQGGCPTGGSALPAPAKAKRRIRPHLPSRTLIMFCIVGALAVVLAILAVLEYQWADTVSEANRERIMAALNLALTEIRTDFDGVLLNLCESLQPASPEESAALYARRVEFWYKNAPHPDLVAGIYTFTPSSGTLREWDSDSKTFVAPPHPQRFAPLMASLRDPAWFAATTSVSRTAPVVWNLMGGAPVLVRRFSMSGPAGPQSFFGIELKADALQRHIFPQLIRGHFRTDQEIEYRIAVLNGRTGALLYESEPALSPGRFPHYDEKLTLLGDPDIRSQGPEFWELAAAHRSGTVSAVVTSVRRRWLAIDFGVLLVLALGIATIIISTLRAQTFLRLQMEFVASVSHELRTPLSVIGSAADNLAEGVVRSDQSVREYGSLIRSECRRLSGLVEQTLRFAAGKADYRSRNVQFLRVSEVIDKALAETAIVIDASGFTLEKNIEAGLPMIRVDPGTLSECLLNLISNALKYGGSKRWLGIRAQPIETGRGTGVQITVEDRGPGIPPEELPYVFEPFYRGRAAREAQIRGTGLGLSLAQEAANSMGARITVESMPGEGSAFTIHLSAAFMSSSTIPVDAMVES